VAERINLFSKIISDHFSYKSMTISKEKGFTFRTHKENLLDPSSLSSGEQHELVLLYELLFKIKSNSLVLIDEPELSLHICNSLQNKQHVVTNFKPTPSFVQNPCAGGFQEESPCKTSVMPANYIRADYLLPLSPVFDAIFSTQFFYLADRVQGQTEFTDSHWWGYVDRKCSLDVEFEEFLLHFTFLLVNHSFSWLSVGIQGGFIYYNLDCEFFDSTKGKIYVANRSK
jgi:hypothetical protein